MLCSISEYVVVIVHAVTWVLRVRCSLSTIVICCLCELYLLKVIPCTAYPGHDLTACVAFMFKFMHSLRMPDSTFGVCRVQYYPLESSRSRVSPFVEHWCGICCTHPHKGRMCMLFRVSSAAIHTTRSEHMVGEERRVQKSVCILESYPQSTHLLRRSCVI